MRAFPAILVVSLLLLPACEKQKDDYAERTAQAQGTLPERLSPAVLAREVFNNNCVMCHGLSGRGDGTAAANLQPRPRDYTDPTWQAAVTDDQIRKAILFGGPAVGKAPTMMAFGNLPDLKDPAVVDELVALVRRFAKP